MQLFIEAVVKAVEELLFGAKRTHPGEDVSGDEACWNGFYRGDA